MLTDEQHKVLEDWSAKICCHEHVDDGILQVHNRAPGDVQPDLVASVVDFCLAQSQNEGARAGFLHSVSKDTALLTIDVLASHTLLTSQFVDDVFIFQSTIWGVHRACRALEEFLQFWRHRFASGHRKVALMLVSSEQLDPSALPSLDTANIEGVFSIPILGPCFDCNLSFSAFVGNHYCKVGS